MGFDLKKEAKFLSTRMDDKTAASVGLGAALMLVFGLGTSVCMLVFGLLGDALTRKYNNTSSKRAPSSSSPWVSCSP